MVDDDMLKKTIISVTLSQPIELVAPNIHQKRVLVTGEEEFIAAGDFIRDFIERWVIKFLNEYTSPQDIINGYEKGDSRPFSQEDWYLYVTAAYVVLNRINDAYKVLNDRYYRPGSRKRYAKAFEYVEKLRNG